MCDQRPKHPRWRFGRKRTSGDNSGLGDDAPARVSWDSSTTTAGELLSGIIGGQERPIGEIQLPRDGHQGRKRAAATKID
jgi:hypothetical protein